jgi:hypothetical protein
MTQYNLTVSDYRKIHAKREAEMRSNIIKKAWELINDHPEHKMVTVIDKDTTIINY